MISSWMGAIQALLLEFDQLSIQYIYNVFNQEADALSKRALFSSEGVFFGRLGITIRLLRRELFWFVLHIPDYFFQSCIYRLLFFAALYSVFAGD